MRNWILLFVAGLIAYIMLPILFIYSIIKNRFKREMQDYILLKFATNIDIIGNINGDLIRDLVILDNSKPCLFNRSGITISASLGQLIATNNINKRGLWFSGILNKAFKMDNHCLDAYNSLDLN